MATYAVEFLISDDTMRGDLAHEFGVAIPAIGVEHNSIAGLDADRFMKILEIGRASCRERV